MEGSGIGQFIPLILIFVIFYFFLIRPQQKKVKEHKAMVESLKRGDKVITSGGITGTVERLIDNDKVEVEIAENVKVKPSRGNNFTPLPLLILILDIAVKIPPKDTSWQVSIKFSFFKFKTLVPFCFSLNKLTSGGGPLNSDSIFLANTDWSKCPSVLPITIR